MRCPECGAIILPFGLSARQVECLHLASEGYSNKQIGIALGISQNTVKEHLTTCYVHLRARGRTQAVIRAIKAGLIEIEPAGEGKD